MVLSDVPGTGRDILLRNGWHALESYGGEPFRWARNNAMIVVPLFEPSHVRLNFDIEMGPGVAERPAPLTVYNAANDRLLETLLEGRKTLSLFLENRSPSVHALRLCFSSSGQVSGLDHRILDFRLFGASVEAVRDIVSDTFGATLGSGWFDLEFEGAETFRWAQNDARICVGDLAAERTEPIEFDLEPGPSVGSDSMELTVLDDSDRVLARTVIFGRERLRIAPQRIRGRELRFHIEGSEETAMADGRVMNFRMFSDRS